MFAKKGTYSVVHVICATKLVKVGFVSFVPAKLGQSTNRPVQNPTTLHLGFNFRKLRLIPGITHLHHETTPLSFSVPSFYVALTRFPTYPPPSKEIKHLVVLLGSKGFHYGALYHIDKKQGHFIRWPSISCSTKPSSIKESSK